MLRKLAKSIRPERDGWLVLCWTQQASALLSPRSSSVFYPILQTGFRIAALKRQTNRVTISKRHLSDGVGSTSVNLRRDRLTDANIGSVRAIRFRTRDGRSHGTHRLCIASSTWPLRGLDSIFQVRGIVRTLPVLPNIRPLYSGRFCRCTEIEPSQKFMRWSLTTSQSTSIPSPGASDNVVKGPSITRGFRAIENS